MDPDHALARLILVDIADGKSARVMKDSIKPWWVKGLAMANGSPKEISWSDMFPICARLIKQYEKAVPDASRHKGAFAMLPEWLDIISEYVVENILVKHKGVSLYKYWSEYTDIQRIRIQTANKKKCKEPQYKLEMTGGMLYVRAHAVQKLLEATAARSAHVSKASNDNPRVIEHKKLGKIDPHLRNWCFNPIRTGGRKGKTNLKDFVYDLLDQKSWKHNIKWLTAERDLRKYKIKDGAYKGAKIMAYDPLFWVMVWSGGSIIDDPGRWLQKFYTKARKGSKAQQRIALILRHYAAAYYMKYWKKRKSKLGRSNDWIEKACTACSQKTLNEANYKLLHFVRNNTLDRVEWTWILLYADEQKVSKLGGIFSGWSLHSLRKLCGKRAMKKWIDSGLSDGGKMLLLQRMRWTSIDMSAIYTMQSAVNSAMTCRDMENRSSLNQALMALAFANQDGEVSIDGETVPVCNKTAMAHLVSQIAGICAA